MAEDLTPKFPLISKEVELHAGKVSNMSDFLGEQFFGIPLRGTQNSANFRKSETGFRNFTVEDGGDIQAAVDEANASGGGRVFVKNGTHLISSDIILYSNIYLEGENAGSTVLDFQTNAFGIIAVGTNAYSTGTLSVTNNATTVIGSGTTWTAEMVGRKILLDGLWYIIAARTNDTTIHIAAPFAGVTLSGASYTLATLKEDVKVTNMTIRNASSGIKFQYVGEIFFSDVDVQTSVTGITGDDSSQIAIREIDLVANNSGVAFTNCHFIGADATGAIDTQAGNGMTLNAVTNSSFTSMFMVNSSADGVNFTDCSNIKMDGTFLENGGEGIEFVSGNSDIVVSQSAIENNASDGVKFTATSDNCFLYGCSIKSNGGWGVNLVDSTSDNLVITTCNFLSNSSGAVDDNGTGTVIRGNVGVNDNSTGQAATELGFYGDGSDGALSTSGNVTLTEDKYYTNLTINDGHTFDPAGFRVFCTGTLTVGGGSSGIIERNGNNGNNGNNATGNAGATGGTGGTAVADGYLRGSLVGATGATGGNGAASSKVGGDGNGTDIINSIGLDSVAGGDGGIGGTGTGIPGSGGTSLGATATPANVKLIASSQILLLLDVEAAGTTIKYTNSAVAGSGAGGGGGAIGISNDGGGGGGGGGSASCGGIIAIYAMTIVINANASIVATGGVGGDGGNGFSPVSGLGSQGGGGGGGGAAGGNGGQLVLVYNSLTNNGSLTVTGGAGGTGGTGGTGHSGGGTGANGSPGNNGTAGTVHQFQF